MAKLAIFVCTIPSMFLLHACIRAKTSGTKGVASNSTAVLEANGCIAKAKLDMHHPTFPALGAADTQSLQDFASFFTGALPDALSFARTTNTDVLNDMEIDHLVVNGDQSVTITNDVTATTDPTTDSNEAYLSQTVTTKFRRNKVLAYLVAQNFKIVGDSDCTKTLVSQDINSVATADGQSYTVSFHKTEGADNSIELKSGTVAVSKAALDGEALTGLNPNLMRHPSSELSFFRYISEDLPQMNFTVTPIGSTSDTDPIEGSTQSFSDFQITSTTDSLSIKVHASTASVYSQQIYGAEGSNVSGSMTNSLDRSPCGQL